MAFFDDMVLKKGAEFSPDRKYRYTLTRRWGSGKILCVIGLNPSTADELVDDRTICRCMKFASDNGFQQLTMVNLFAIRATDPYDMLAAISPIGPDNDRHLLTSAADAHRVLAAWGAHGMHRGRAGDVLNMISKELHCLGVNADGSPKHPLYVPAAHPMEIYKWNESGLPQRPASSV